MLCSLKRGPVAQHGWSVRLIIERSPVQIRLGPPPTLIQAYEKFLLTPTPYDKPGGKLLTKEDEMLEELKKIRESLEKGPPPQPPKGLWNEFKDFLSKYKILGLAVAFVLGLYLGTLVQALVKDLLMPALGLLIPGMDDLATLAVTVSNQIFAIGDFLVALITFIIVAFIVFIVVKVAKRWNID